MAHIKRILWCITGSGSFLRDIYFSFREVRNQYNNLEVAIAFSRAGREVARIYGVLDGVWRVATRSRYGGVYYEEDSSSGVPLAGRIQLKIYDVILLAPATSNSVAKLVHGIADSLPTICVNQALKAGIDVIVFPSDYDAESITHLPCYIDNSICNRCLKCLESDVCPYSALYPYYEYKLISPRIDYMKCRGCEKCIMACQVNAIRCWEEVKVKPTKTDLDNVKRLKEIDGVYVVVSVDKLMDKLIEILKL